MGRNEFYAWVNQLYAERLEENKQGESWEASENDPAWQAMRDKRKRRQGR